MPARRHWAGPLRVARFTIMVAGVACVGTAFGSIPIVVTGYAETTAPRSLAGWLLAAQASGALVGGLLYIRANPGGLRRLPVVAGALTVGFLPLLLVPGPPLMAGLLAVSGLALPPVLTTVFLATDRLTPPGTAVEAFAWIITAFTVGTAAGAAVVGPLVATGIRYGFAFAPAVLLLSVVAMTVVSRATGPAPADR